MRPNPQFPDDLVIFAEEILSPISTGGKEEGGGGVPQGYNFVENSWTANDFKLKFCHF